MRVIVSARTGATQTTMQMCVSKAVSLHVANELLDPGATGAVCLQCDCSAALESGSPGGIVKGPFLTPIELYRTAKEHAVRRPSRTPRTSR